MNLNAHVTHLRYLLPSSSNKDRPVWIGSEEWIHSIWLLKKVCSVWRQDDRCGNEPEHDWVRNTGRSGKTSLSLFFCSTALTSIGWVRMTTLSLSTVHQLSSAAVIESLLIIIFPRKIALKKSELRIEPGPPGRKAWALPLCYGGPPPHQVKLRILNGLLA